jgi:protein O-GlcNAc transferase
MGSSCDNVEVSYPTQDILLKEWRSHASPWVDDIFDDIGYGATARAARILNPDRINQLLNEEDSSQKVFDIYGAAMMLTMIKESVRAKDLLIELTKIVPYGALYVNIAGICTKIGSLYERVKFMKKALEKEPENSVVWNFMGSALMSVNEKEKGIEFLRRSIVKRPDNPMPFSNYLFNSHYLPELDCEKLFTDHKRWAQFNAVKDFVVSDHKNVRDLDRKLRIGYISPDFRAHPVGVLIKPIIDSHDRNDYEVFGYGNVGNRDSFTEHMKSRFDHYRNIIGVEGKKVVEIIIDDGIDILIDLAGHTGGNRLDVMAYKPAPIQVTYLGYFDTTGLDQIDYFLTDGQMSPPESQKYHTEKIFQLPHTCFCYNIPDETPAVVSSPVLENDFITFGMFGNPAKITPKSASLWARILQNTDGSRLKLIIKGGQNDEMTSIFSKLLEDAGISRDRVDICGKMPLGEYFAEYGKVDIMLDTYPYNGGATTCDALWMGVPIVSLVGEHHFSRVGLSLLTSVGLDYFACKTEDEYVAKASVLAAKPEALAKIRGTLRQRMQASPICDMELQTKSIENAYREMWRRWCGVKGRC